MAVESHDKKLIDLLDWVEDGKAQLPDFQRSWVWDDTQICKLIESITSGFPMGAAMFLAYGGQHIRFKYRPFEGIELNGPVTPEWLVLDGQQRLTTLYQVLKSGTYTITKLEKNKDVKVKRYYYLDIKKCLDQSADRLDAIISLPERKQLTEDIGRKVVLDLTTRENEYKNLIFPLNITFSYNQADDWRFEMENYYHGDEEYRLLFRQFQKEILRPILDYTMPVIQLDKDTRKEAVCQIFENVNTGGVPLTVFELVTASFAADGHELRPDWESVKASFSKRRDNLLKEVSGANFLAAMSLLITYDKRMKAGEDEKIAVSCKKQDILNLNLEEYLSFHDRLVEGFNAAADFLVQQGIYRSGDLPYSTQLVPLAAIFAYDKGNNHLFNLGNNKEKLARWYWSGVFGELYGSANEARFAQDIIGIFRWIKGGEQPETVTRSNFQPTRLLSLQTRNSAAYKGLMALVLKGSPLDFMTGERMDIASYLEEDADIHHIFPYAYCTNVGIPPKKFNSVINKSPIYATSNRSIGGHAPSIYIGTMARKGLEHDKIVEAIESHMVNFDYLSTDNFDEYFIDRAKKLLSAIESATGKTIEGKDSEETIREFGRSLNIQPATNAAVLPNVDQDISSTKNND